MPAQNKIYPAYCHDVLTGDTPWLTGNLTVGLVDNSAAFNIANTVWADLSGVAVGTPQVLGTKTVSASGTAAGASVTFAGIGPGPVVGAIVLYIDLGGGSTRLIAWWSDVVGLPLVTTGADITIDWNGTAPSGDIIIASGP